MFFLSEIIKQKTNNIFTGILQINEIHPNKTDNFNNGWEHLRRGWWL